MINCILDGNITGNLLQIMKFQIVCDSSADLPQEYVRAHSISVVPFYVSVDGRTYLREGTDISVSVFYHAMEENESCCPKTSMPSIQDYVDVFSTFAKQHKPVLCICLTRLFSGSLQSAQEAGSIVLEEYPDAQIHVMDSQLVTALEGLLVSEACRLRDLGMEMAEAVPLLESIRSTGHIFFTTKDLKYLERGGRLTKAKRIAGTMLNLKPVLHFCNGELGPVEVSRGRKKSLEKVMNNFFSYLEKEKIDLSEYSFGTGIGLDVPEYEDFVSELERRFDQMGIHPSQWIKVRIGATIGVHTGPYPVGLGLLKRCTDM